MREDRFRRVEHQWEINMIKGKNFSNVDDLILYLKDNQINNYEYLTYLSEIETFINELKNNNSCIKKN